MVVSHDMGVSFSLCKVYMSDGKQKTQGVFYMALGGDGLWKLEYDCATDVIKTTWLSKEGDSVFRMGLGVLSPESDYYKDSKAIYFNGIINGTYGFYRTLDEGKSYERLNTDRQMYGEINRYCVPLRIAARKLKPIQGGSDFELTARFEAFDDEKIFGMGQYQEKHLNKKGAVLELAHRNSQASVPFMVSSRGYGFFWNNPAIGTAAFGTNKTEWYAKSTKKLDYLITAGDTPAESLRGGHSVRYSACMASVRRGMSGSRSIGWEMLGCGGLLHIWS